MPIAFKEWAVTVRALAEGEQLVTLRKGGIREENKHFELEHERFFLYPTFDHQRNDLVRHSHHPELRRALEEGVWPDEEPPPRALIQDGGIPQPDRVRIRAWAEVADHFTVTDRRVVDGLSPFYVWTPDYAEKRLNWKRRHPLHVLLLRVHRIPRPVTVRVRDEYHGCRSWVEIDRDLPFEGTPVMADEEFDRAREEIRGLCAEHAEPALACQPLQATHPSPCEPRSSACCPAPRRRWCSGMGGGGDVVGALATARLCQAFGAEFVLGGVAWERWPIDPHPGPRALDEILGGGPLSSCDGARRRADDDPRGRSRSPSRGWPGTCARRPSSSTSAAGAAATAAGLGEAAARARLRPAGPRRRRRRRTRPRRRARARKPALRRRDARRRGRAGGRAAGGRRASTAPAATAS